MIFMLELHQLARACEIKGLATKKGNAIVQPREVCACHRGQITKNHNLIVRGLNLASLGHFQDEQVSN